MKAVYAACLLSTACCITSAPNTPFRPSTSPDFSPDFSNISNNLSKIILIVGPITLATGYLFLRMYTRRQKNLQFVGALHKQNSADVQRLFLEGADPNRAIEEVDTSVSFGCVPVSGIPFTMKLPLLDHLLSKINRETQNPHAYHDAEQMVLLLLDTSGCIVDYRNRFGRTPLHYAPTKAIALKLIDRTAPINAQDQFGRTPLHEAARKDRLDVVEALTERGAELTIRDHEKRTPLDLILNQTNPNSTACADAIKRADKIKRREEEQEKINTLYSCLLSQGFAPEELINPDVAGPIDILINYILKPTCLSQRPLHPHTVDSTDTYIHTWVTEQEEKLTLTELMLAGGAVAGSIVLLSAGESQSILEKKRRE